MFAGQRINIIKKILLEQKQVDINTLTSLLNVSDVTVRKDLDSLETDGFLRKVHGGAILLEDDPLDMPKNDIPELQEKEMIADLAITLIDDGDNFYLGPGSTCLMLAKKLNQKTNLTVITNNASALPYIDCSSVNLLFIGGDVVNYNNMMFTHGEKALAYLEDIFVNKAFIGTDCVDLEAGLTINHSYSLDVYKKILDKSRQTILLASKSKFDRIALQLLCPINAISALVTEGDLPEKYKRYLYQNDIKLLTSFDL